MPRIFGDIWQEYNTEVASIGGAVEFLEGGHWSVGSSPSEGEKVGGINASDQ
jgi:hypothetical protein